MLSSEISTRSGAIHLLRVCYGIARRTFKGVPNYNASEYWKHRASASGESSVMFQNQAYNKCCRMAQRECITPIVSSLPANANILDIGCGIGVVAKMLVDIHPTAVVDAVDFGEMIQRAQAENADSRISYISSSAEDYKSSPKKYDLILSAGCYSAIRDLEKMQRAFENAVDMLKDDGIILLIDPFHGNRWMARAKFSSAQVDKVFREYGLSRIEKSGILFWPFREWLANSTYKSDVIERRFAAGEKLLRTVGQHQWADYKVLAYRRSAGHA